MRYDGSIGLVTREGNTAPGVSGTFTAFGDPVINGYGEVAFVAKLALSPTVTAENNQGIWTDLGGSLKLVCREGTAPAGMASGYTFKTFQWFNLSDDLLYVGAQTTNGTTTLSGVWKYDGTTFSKVCAQGDSMLLSGSTRVIKSIINPTGSQTGNAQSRVASSSGRLVLEVSSSNGYEQYVTFP